MSNNQTSKSKKRFSQYLLGTCIFSFLFSSIILINVFQMLSLILIRPFSKNAFRKVNRFFADLWWGWGEISVNKLLKVDIIEIGDKLPIEENAILICNHQSMADIPILFKIAKRSKRLGDMKWFVKDGLKHVPGIGWGMQFLDCLFVKRDWHADKDKIHRTFKKFFDENIPIWLMIFPEGTRFKPEKQKKSAAYAIKNNLPQLSNVLLPRPKGFSASVQGLRGHAKAVYDVTIKYDGEIPSFVGLFYGDIRRVEMKITRISLEDLSTDEDSLSKWLIGRFSMKDLFLKEGH